MFGNFIKPLAQVVKVNDNTEEILKGLLALKDIDVLVGIPQEKSSRKGEPITNAELAFIHTNGSPINNIPPRPFLHPAIEKNKEVLAKYQLAAILAALDGKASEAKNACEKLGMKAASLAKSWFTDSRNGWAPNKPKTISKKGSSNPLIDTSAMRNAITYVVRQK